MFTAGRYGTNGRQWIFFGIRFAGHPDPKPLLLPEDMTDRPLQRKENDRASLRDLLNPGEILKRDPDFLIFDDLDSPAGVPEPHGETPEAKDGAS